MRTWKESFLAIDTESVGMPRPGVTPRLFALATALYERRVEVSTVLTLFSPPEGQQVNRSILDANLDLVPASARGQLDRLPTFRGRASLVQDRLLSSRVWAGHHIPFDLACLTQEFKFASRDLDRFMKANDITVVDTRPLAAWLRRAELGTERRRALAEVGLKACLERWAPETLTPAPKRAEAVLQDVTASARLLLGMMKELPDDLEELRALQQQAAEFMQKTFPTKASRVTSPLS